MRHVVLTSVIALVAEACLGSPRAQAARQWDPYEAITFTVSGTDAPIAPSNIGDNGLVTRQFDIIAYADADHWIDSDESPPGEDWPSETLPLADIDYSTDAPSPGGLVPGADCFVYTAPDIGGDFEVILTGTDRSQAIGPGEGGSRHDTDNTDNWWNLGED